MSNEHNSNNNNIAKSSAKAGISFGAGLAMVISYANWHSVLWAIIHGAMSWIYVIYFIIKYGWN